ncbi:MAG: hypothetical protein R3305_04885, partial [Gammaproteobacteria bacterium]|nr:hypothetical protein [Gammaproteobacteria bacterium]
VRTLIAAVGAVVVTGALLLAMDTVTSLFERNSGQRYFSISDILPRPDPGRPERPGQTMRQPNAPTASGDVGSQPLIVESPEAVSVGSVVPRPDLPEIDAQDASADAPSAAPSTASGREAPAE